MLYGHVMDMGGRRYKNMKLEYADGCTCTSLTVDGKETIDMDINSLKEVVIKLINRETDFGVIQGIWIDLMGSQGEFEDLGVCEECGDWITKYTLEIQ